jgi:hypothetical protein
VNKSLFKEIFTVNYLLGLFSLLSVFFYVICATPTYGFRDGPELAVTAAFLDVAHPSGFPSFNLLAKIFTWLPLASLPFRVTLFTALAGGAATFCLGLLLKKLHNLAPEKPSYFFLFLPLLFFALHQSIFGSSIEVEVYSLNAALIAVLLFCSTLWYSGLGVVWLFIGGFLYGLACGNHASLSLYLPVLILLTFWTRPPDEELPSLKVHSRRILWLAVFFLVGLSVYLMLIIRSQTDRLPVDFSRTNTWARFWMHISDSKDKQYHFQGLLNFKELFYFIKIHFERLTSPLFYLAVPFILWGLKYLWRRYQILSVALIVLIGINLFFFYYWIDGTSAFIPSLVCFFILLGLGLGQLGRSIRGKKFLPELVNPLAVIILFSSAFIMGEQRYNESDAQSGFMATEFFWWDLEHLPPDALAFHSAQWFSELALQNLYAVRPDVSIVFLNGLIQPQYFVSPVPAKFPNLIFPRLPDGSIMPAYYPDYFTHFVVLNMDAGKPVYIQYGSEMGPLFDYMVPEEPIRFMGRLTKDIKMVDKSFESGLYPKYLKWFRRYFVSLSLSDDPPLASKVPAYLMYISDPVFLAAADLKYYGEATQTVETYINSFTRNDGTFMFPSDVALNLHAFLANIFRLEKNYPKALKYVKKLISLSPYNANSHYMLGLIYDNQKMAEETLAAWKTATEIDKYEIGFFYHYSLALAKYRSVQEAVKFLEERAGFFKGEYMQNLSALALQMRDCFLLPPEEIGYFTDVELMKELEND